MASIGIIVLGVVLFGPKPGEGRWASELANAAHGPAFAILTLIVIALMRRIPIRRASLARDYSVALATAFLLGALIELLQPLIGRDASFHDLLWDSLGALAAIGFITLVDPRVCALPSHRPVQFTGLLVGVASTAIIAIPLVITGTAYLQRHRGFPTLVDFSSPVATRLLGIGSSVTVERSELPIELRSGDRDSVGLRAHLTENARWILVLSEPVADWRGYTRLNLDVANPTAEPLALRLRVFDRVHGRNRHTGYRGSINVAPHSRAKKSFHLAAMNSGAGEAQTDTSHVHSIVIARASANRAREFYVMRIWLD